MKEPKIIYYKDELNDEFSKAKIIPRKLYIYSQKSIMEYSIFFSAKCI